MRYHAQHNPSLSGSHLTRPDPAEPEGIERLLRGTADHDALVGVLFHERDLLERILFRTIQLALIVGHRESAHVVAAVDELIELEDQLAEAEIVRAAIVEDLAPNGTTSMTALAETAPIRLQEVMGRLSQDLRRLVGEIRDLRQETLSAIDTAGKEIAATTRRLLSGTPMAYDATGRSAVMDPSRPSVVASA